jgi:hypothetical protein
VKRAKGKKTTLHCIFHLAVGANSLASKEKDGNPSVVKIETANSATHHEASAPRGKKKDH